MKQQLGLDGTDGAGARRINFRQKPDGTIDPAGEAGWYLQYERERRGETLADAAVETRIKAKYLHALELGALDQLPGWPYVIGYVRNYAKFLGLEPGPLAQHYLTFVKRPAMIERLAGRSVFFQNQAAARTVAAGAGAAVIAVMGLWAVFSDGSGSLVEPRGDGRSKTAQVDTTQVQASRGDVELVEADPVITGSIRRPELAVAALPAAPAPVPAPTASTPSDAVTRTKPKEAKPSVILDGAVPTVRIKEKSLTGGTAVPRPVPRSAVLQSDVETALASEGDDVAAPSDMEKFIASQLSESAQGKLAAVSGGPAATDTGDSRIVLRARANVWVRVEDGEGNALLNQTLARGEVFHVPDRAGMVLIVRDAGALEFSLDGKPYVRLGQSGQILVSHPLVPGKMRTLGG